MKMGGDRNIVNVGNPIAIVRKALIFMGLIGIDRSGRAIGSLNNIGERGDRKKIRLMIVSCDRPRIFWCPCKIYGKPAKNHSC